MQWYSGSKHYFFFANVLMGNPGVKGCPCLESSFRSLDYLLKWLFHFWFLNHFDDKCKEMVSIKMDLSLICSCVVKYCNKFPCRPKQSDCKRNSWKYLELAKNLASSSRHELNKNELFMTPFQMDHLQSWASELFFTTSGKKCAFFGGGRFS